jgi:hypothetical protein
VALDEDGMHTRTFAPDDLERIPDPLAFARRYFLPLALGDHCRLNSGGLIGIVIDAAGADLTVAWPTGEEAILPRACLHRYN